jgi:hypothetical protein
MLALAMIVLLVVGYAWSVWLLWRQMHFDETPGGSTPQAHDHASLRGVAPRLPGAMIASSGGRLANTPRSDATDRFPEFAGASPAARRETLDVRREIEARVYRLSSLLDRRPTSAPSGRFKP